MFATTRKALTAGLLVTLILTQLTAISSAQDDSPTTWTDARGKKLEAEFVRLADDGVILKLKSNGRETEVALSVLSLDSQLQAIKLGNPDEFSKPRVSASMPAADVDIPVLDPAEVARSPFAADNTLEKFIETVQYELQNNNQLVLWHALTPRMQADVEDMIVRGAALGEPFRVQFKTLLGHLDTIAQNQREFVLAHPMVAGQPQIAEGVGKMWPYLSAMTGAISDEQLWEKENFQKGKVVPWMIEFGAKVGPPAEKFFGELQNVVPPSMMPPGQPAQVDYKDLSFKIDNQSANSATVTVTAGENEVFNGKVVKVEGRWLPERMVENWDRNMDMARRQLDSVNPADLTAPRFLFGGIVAVASRVANAQDQQSFNQAIDELTQSFGGMGGPGSGPPADGGRPGGGGRPGSGRPGNPF